MLVSDAYADHHGRQHVSALAAPARSLAPTRDQSPTSVLIRLAASTHDVGAEIATLQGQLLAATERLEQLQASRAHHPVATPTAPPDPSPLTVLMLAPPASASSAPHLTPPGGSFPGPPPEHPVTPPHLDGPDLHEAITLSTFGTGTSLYQVRLRPQPGPSSSG